MQSIRAWTAKNPLLVALLALLAAFLYFVFPAILSGSAELFGHGRQEKGAADFSQVLMPETALVVTLLAVVVLIGWSNNTGLTTRLHFKPLFLAVPYVLFVALIAVSPAILLLSDGATTLLSASDLRLIGLSILAALLVGAFEELLFRGILLHGLRAHMAAVPAVLVSALIFGAFHFVNWVGGQPFDITFSQVLGAAGGGVFYGAMVLWTGSLWPSIVLHGLWDAGVTISQTFMSKTSTPPAAESGAGPNQLSALLSPELIYGLFLLAIWWFWSKRKA